MKTVAIITQKGGAGKTTLTLHLAVAADRAGLNVAAIDMDPQGTLETWATWRNNEDHPAVLPAKAPTLARALDRAKAAGIDLAFIDTPPLASGEAAEAARLADLILMPSKPNDFDLAAIGMTASLARQSGKPAFVVFNEGSPTAKLMYADCQATVAQMGLATCPLRFSRREAFAAGAGSGSTAQEIEPDGKAAEEVSQLWQWLAGELDVKSRKVFIARRVRT